MLIWFADASPIISSHCLIRSTFSLVPRWRRDLYRQNWLTSGLSRLKPLLRETFVLVVREDMTHAEAAHALGVAESTVSWRIHEARKELDAQFNGAL